MLMQEKTKMGWLSVFLPVQPAMSVSVAQAPVQPVLVCQTLYIRRKSGKKTKKLNPKPRPNPSRLLNFLLLFRMIKALG